MDRYKKCGLELKKDQYSFKRKCYACFKDQFFFWLSVPYEFGLINWIVIDDSLHTTIAAFAAMMLWAIFLKIYQRKKTSRDGKDAIFAVFYTFAIFTSFIIFPLNVILLATQIEPWFALFQIVIIYLISLASLSISIICTLWVIIISRKYRKSINKE
ncbi:MAG: hypothetical protein ACFFCS_28730 [Candidatus Hodarchaeota archaeon]